MKKKFPFAVLLALVCCSKSTISKDEFDKSKFISKDWYWDGKKTPQWLTIRFNTNDTAIMTQCTWLIPPYRFNVLKYRWREIGKDSIELGSTRFRVYSINDSVLVTNNWVVGMSPRPDTSRVTFTTY